VAFTALNHLQLQRKRAVFEEADLIRSYSRTDTIPDGVLIDVSAAAREAGIRLPTALNRAAEAGRLALAERTVLAERLTVALAHRSRSPS
jgi:hypothetical protein